MSKNKIEVSDIDGIFKTHREGSVQNLMERWGYVTKDGETFLTEAKEPSKEKEEKPESGLENKFNKKKKRPWLRDDGTSKDDEPLEVTEKKRPWLRDDGTSKEDEPLEVTDEQELDEAIAPMNVTSYETTDERRINGKSDTDDCACQDKPLPSTVEAKFEKLDQKKLDEVMKRVLARVMKEVRGTDSKKKV